jgi:hypothetical protein
MDEDIISEEHLAEHADRSLAMAAACYAGHYAQRAWMLESYSDGARRYKNDAVPDDWPESWAETSWRPRTPSDDLVLAAALLIAEIDRLDRNMSQNGV